MKNFISTLLVVTGVLTGNLQAEDKEVGLFVGSSEETEKLAPGALICSLSEEECVKEEITQNISVILACKKCE